MNPENSSPDPNSESSHLQRSLPLNGIRVLDFSRVVVGPICTQMLGDLGADICKVEPINTGDFSRSFLKDEQEPGESFSFLSLNRNKKSICIDVRQEEGKSIALKLAKDADVVVQNFRPGVMTRLGLNYEDIRECNAGIIYASVTGYGETGPYAAKPGQDLLAQSIAGAPWLSGEPEGPPVHSGAIIADHLAGMVLVQGILAALVERQNSGLGQEVHVSLLTCMLHLQSEFMTMFLNNDQSQQIKNTRPLNRLYQTKDSKWIAIAGTFGPNPLREVCQAMELSDLSDDERFNTWRGANYENADELTSILSSKFSSRPREEWLSILEAKDILCAPVNQYSDTFCDPQVIHNASTVSMTHPVNGEFRTIRNPIDFSAHGEYPCAPPPLLGQHTTEILRELGYTVEEEQTLRESFVIA